MHPPYAAYLRVYEPLAAFAEPERSYWQGYAARRPRPGAVDEHRRRLADLIATPPVAVPEQESRDAFVQEKDGVLYLCPWQTRLRSWLALDQLIEELPLPLLDTVVPPLLRDQAEADWDRWRAQHPDGRPWILTSTWNIPVRWFLLFGDEEREYIPAEGGADGDASVDSVDGTSASAASGVSAAGGGPAGDVEPSERPAADGVDAVAAQEGLDGASGAQGANGANGANSGANGGANGGEEGGGRKGARRARPRPAPVLRYRTPMAQARRRVARGFRVLRETLDDGPLVEGVEQVGRWLEEFHPRSLVELDYGGLVHAIPEPGLAEDRSAEEVAEGVAALRAGDPVRAGRCYRSLTERWRRVQELQYAN